MRTSTGPPARAARAFSAAATASEARRESDEERVSLRVDFDTVRLLEGGSENQPVIAEQVGVPRAVLAKKPRRAGDVREEERDGTGRKTGHDSTLSKRQSEVESANPLVA